MRKIDWGIDGPEVSQVRADGSGGGTSEAALEGERSECESVQGRVGTALARTIAWATIPAEQLIQF